MTDVQDTKAGLAGTVANNRGGEATINDLTDEVIIWQKTADDSAAGDATDERAIFCNAPFAFRVMAVTWQQNAALTGHADNKATFNVKKSDSGGSKTTVATKVTDTPTTDDIAANTDYDIPITAAAASVARGQTLHFGIAKAGTGVVVSEGSLTVHIRRE